eukprot:TRINITY_DN4020_c0_g1_i2.p1 TRINITY_DN4020_c0_g1~~TRINITY_DN4020_c0_g1_i2.p1  ORF type:complete len:297 (-),score=74.56 TRINITY_DN4020_c0_g1_i2:596-1486(-)
MEGKLLSRRATHAGSWYTSNPKTLKSSLSKFLEGAEKKYKGTGLVKYVIGPHAGFDYCAETAAYAYKCVDPDKYRRVILMGPSHYVHINYCALTKCTVYETPLGNMEVDTETVNKLLKVKGFKQMDIDVDEQEHSLEMHLPFLKQIFGNRKVLLVPIMVGSITEDQEKSYGETLAEFMKDDETLFAVSSDFCHWGMRFGYTYYRKEDGKIFESIEKLDRRAMDAIEKNDPKAVADYFDETDNTICGRHPIAIAINALQATGCAFETKFVHYSQSEQVTSRSGSSVSYAAAYSAKTS